MPNIWSWTIRKIIIYRRREKLVLVWIILEFSESWILSNCYYSFNAYFLKIHSLYLFIYLHMSYNFTSLKEQNNHLINYPWENLFISIWVLCSADLTLSWSYRAGGWRSTVEPSMPWTMCEAQGSGSALIMTASKGTGFVEEISFRGKNRNCSLCHHCLFHIIGKCKFPTESQG